MRCWIRATFVVLALLAAQAAAAPFVVFPKAGRLISPDGRYEVRDADRTAASADFSGTFHSLWLIELATGRSRKLCDYLGVAAVAWAGNDFLVATQYVGKKTSRALVFAIAGSEDPVILDRSTLIQLLAPEFREHLRGNDHAFVEASRLESDIFYFGVWGYGQQDPHGFRWTCQYSLRVSKASCDFGK